MFDGFKLFFLRISKIYLVTMSHQRDAGQDFAPLGFPGGEFLHANKRGDKTNRLHSSTSSVNSDCLNFHKFIQKSFLFSPRGKLCATYSTKKSRLLESNRLIFGVRVRANQTLLSIAA